jgi:hypothetical protein
MEEIPTFYSGDTISIEFALRDDSGVSSVVAVFAHINPGAFTYGDPTSRYEDIQLAGDGRGQPKATVTISGKVEESTASGEYACRFVQARNVTGNYRTFHPDPDIRFRVENGPGNREGPQLSNWRFSGTPEPQPPWWRRLLG